MKDENDVRESCRPENRGGSLIGPHLIPLQRHSDDVLATFLAMAGREDLMVAVKLATAEAVIADLLESLSKLRGDTSCLTGLSCRDCAPIRTVPEVSAAAN